MSVAIFFYYKLALVNNMGTRKLNGKLNVISKNLIKYRNEKNISQADLCKKLALLGIPLYTNDIYKIEHNKRTVKDYELYALSKVLNVKIEDLLEGVKKEFE